MVATAFALFDVAWSAWSADPAARFPEILDDLFARFGPIPAPGHERSGHPPVRGVS